MGPNNEYKYDYECNCKDRFRGKNCAVTDLFNDYEKQLILDVAANTKNFRLNIESLVAETNSQVAETNNQVAETNNRVGETNSKVGETNSKVGETNSKVIDTKREQTIHFWVGLLIFIAFCFFFLYVVFYMNKPVVPQNDNVGTGETTKTSRRRSLKFPSLIKRI
jgi:Fe2+ transport system protein B